jgi:hypothetical protein
MMMMGYLNKKRELLDERFEKLLKDFKITLKLKSL